MFAKLSLAFQTMSVSLLIVCFLPFPFLCSTLLTQWLDTFGVSCSSPDGIYLPRTIYPTTDYFPALYLISSTGYIGKTERRRSQLTPILTTSLLRKFEHFTCRSALIVGLMNPKWTVQVITCTPYLLTTMFGYETSRPPTGWRLKVVEEVGMCNNFTTTCDRVQAIALFSLLLPCRCHSSGWLLRPETSTPPSLGIPHSDWWALCMSDHSLFGIA